MHTRQQNAASQADNGAHMAHFRHIEGAQKGCSLLWSTAGVEDGEGLVGQGADAAAADAAYDGAIARLVRMAAGGAAPSGVPPVAPRR